MSSIERHETAAADRVPWGQLVAYGMGGLIPIALFNIAGQLMGLLGNISLGLSALWLGTIMIIPRLWDAISDPVVGHLSDNTRTRWGRRRPYILIGGIAVALSFVAMWWVPRSDWIRELFASDAGYNWFQLAYILFGLLVFFSAVTVFEIPHGALGMEMSSDYHERTRLFSAKSFLGNLFAMGTPWLIFLAGLDFFRGPGGDLTEGMRYVSIFVAALLIPMTFWWFTALREPGFAIAKQQHKGTFWSDMSSAAGNTTFLTLVGIIFTLAMGFNFVSLFNYYITIFYLYGGDTVAASPLLGLAGTVWAITGLIAVFPLNWLSHRLGKNKTLLIAILLMCAAQVSKIVCYDPTAPYLVLVPTVLLSGGMLMFFTLGSSMVGDVCDEAELSTGTRAEGSYYSVYWWFIKMGTAFASFVTGALLVFTGFDEQQNVAVTAISGSVSAVKAQAEEWSSEEEEQEASVAKFVENLEEITKNADKLRLRLMERRENEPRHSEHIRHLVEQVDAIHSISDSLKQQYTHAAPTPTEVIHRADELANHAAELRQQTPTTLFRLRLVEIGLPLILSCVSIVLTLRYPLTESRCYEIKEALKERRSMTQGESN